MPGRYQALDYLDILFSNGPTAPTLEAVQETLDSGEYKDIFFDRREEGLVLVGDDYGIVEDAPLPLRSQLLRRGIGAQRTRKGT